MAEDTMAEDTMAEDRLTLADVLVSHAAINW